VGVASRERKLRNASRVRQVERAIPGEAALGRGDGTEGDALPNSNKALLRAAVLPNQPVWQLEFI
jgi:hypothetical protein